MQVRTLKIKVRIVVEADEGSFHAYCPELRGLHVDGATEGEALDNARVAVRLYVNSLIKHDDPIPIGALENAEIKTLGQLVNGFVTNLFPSSRHTHIEELSLAA